MVINICMDYQDLLAQNGGVWGKNGERGCAMLTPNELVFTFRVFYVYANFGENRSRNVTMRVCTDGHTHRHRDIDANQFYNQSHATCCSYEEDKNITIVSGIPHPHLCINQGEIWH